MCLGLVQKLVGSSIYQPSLEAQPLSSHTYPNFISSPHSGHFITTSQIVVWPILKPFFRKKGLWVLCFGIWRRYEDSYGGGAGGAEGTLYVAGPPFSPLDRGGYLDLGIRLQTDLQCFSSVPCIAYEANME